MTRRRCLTLLFLAASATLPGLFVRLAHVPLPSSLTALVAGLAILGASFLLLWACDAVQADISQALALAVVALIAVLPEYAVDMYFTWQAGQHPETAYAHYAVANMTGANRMLIGVAWAVIVAIFWVKTKRPVRIERERRLELFFLGAATLYAFVIPLKGSLAWYDGVAFLTLYAWYITLAAKRPCGECDVDGPADVILQLPKAKRRTATGGLFLVAALAIGLNAAPFCEGLIGTGKALRVNEFLLVQWLAPIASEAPEFIVAITFALRRQAGLALGSLLSAKLNQWTLLVGMIPLVYAVSHGTLEHPIPMSSGQMHEILLTAAQSVLGVVLLASLRLSIWQALLLFSLFAGQFVAPGMVAMMPRLLPEGLTADRIHQVFSLLYVIAAAVAFVERPRRLAGLWTGLRETATPPEPACRYEREWNPKDPFRPLPQCARCPHRQAYVRRETVAAGR